MSAEEWTYSMSLGFNGSTRSGNHAALLVAALHHRLLVVLLHVLLEVLDQVGLQLHKDQRQGDGGR